MTLGRLCVVYNGSDGDGDARFPVFEVAGVACIIKAAVILARRSVVTRSRPPVCVRSKGEFGGKGELRVR